MILADTNILARSVQHGHIHQRAAIDAISWFYAQAGETIAIVPQNLVEFYAICTRANNGLNKPAAEALSEIDYFKRKFQLLPETADVFLKWEQLVAKYHPTNRLVFDLRLVAHMLVHQVPSILSFNDQDFQQFSEIKVINPFDVLGIARV